MQVIYHNIPETIHVSTVYIVAVILLLEILLHIVLFPMLIVLYSYISTSDVCVRYPIWLFLLFLDVGLAMYITQVLSE